MIRQAAVQARPSLPEELCAAFDLAKAIAYRTLEDERMTSLPLMRSYLDETVAMFGDDPRPYGVERNRSALDRFLGYAHEQGFTRQRLTPESLFDNPARDFPLSRQDGLMARVTDDARWVTPTAGSRRDRSCR